MCPKTRDLLLSTSLSALSMVTMSSIGVTPSGVATGGHEKSANGANARYADTSEDAGATILQTLIQVLAMLKSRLNEPALQADINRRLHDSESLPDKKIVPLAAKAVDVLHEIEQMLQPAQLVLADHFLGWFSFVSSTFAVL